MATNDIDEGLRVALLMWTALTKGNVAAWHYWQYAQPAQQDQSSSIIGYSRAGGYTVAPRYHCMQQWMLHVKRGARRIDASTDNDSIHVAAFTHQGELAVVLVNRTETAIDAELALPQRGGHVQHWRTSLSEQHAALADRTFGDGRHVLTIPAKSISTLVITGGTQGVEVVSGDPLRLSVWPLPARTSVNVAITGMQGICQLRLVDALGRQVVAEVVDCVNENRREVGIDVHGLPAGVYWIEAAARTSVTGRMIQIIH